MDFRFCRSKVTVAVLALTCTLLLLLHSDEGCLQEEKKWRKFLLSCLKPWGQLILWGWGDSSSKGGYLWRDVSGRYRLRAWLKHPDRLKWTSRWEGISIMRVGSAWGEGWVFSWGWRGTWQWWAGSYELDSLVCLLIRCPLQFVQLWGIFSWPLHFSHLPIFTGWIWASWWASKTATTFFCPSSCPKCGGILRSALWLTECTAWAILWNLS